MAAHLYMYPPRSGDTGREILWQTDARPGAVKEISQFVLFDEQGEETNYIPSTEIKTGGELVDLSGRKAPTPWYRKHRS